ncbi:TPA: hypothetical protein UMZ03_001871 [Stenotrophomonas maltophilia]|uniref:hypothetical protein n=1 Tax=Stenotrophomonas TaxID=40323 RepID=UPI00066EA222|nr:MULTISPECIES: hypothetical protein [Stenotrophomonas]MBH1597453.1 hypothetical protein [Stenotrophomonas maltophilia]MBH1699202.1 hypothetical protein [Stenotrophomonas maltophilia]MBH1711946.1 hypothetical protein [Stenotrophomonas maltophilia]MDQ7301929.1 hypothetical protein [Stenotrophomonas sp. Sm0581]HEL3236827.1 hypothetical protein [Stenotrophomonas maltophilia]
MNQPTTTMHKDSELIDQLGGPAEVARRLGFAMPKGTQRVQNWKYRGIPPYTRVTRTDVFGPAPTDIEQQTPEAGAAA